MLSAPVLAMVSEPVKVPSFSELNETVTGTPLAALAAVMVVGVTLNTPLLSFKVTVTLLVRNRPVTVKVFVTVEVRLALKLSDAGSTLIVGTLACAVPVTFNVTSSAPSLESVRTALALPTLVGL